MQISFVLVDAAVPENIGAAARAIKTMGFTDLRLVNPCDYKCDKALMLAHGSHNILENARVFDSLEKAIEDLDFSIATSAKQRWVKQDIISSREIGKFIRQKSDSISTIAVVFGGEESGLSNSDMALCDVVASIPLPAPYPSLNLSQAVMVFAYSLSEIAQEWPSMKTAGIENSGFKSLKGKVIQILDDIGITNDSLVHGRVLERLAQIADEDVNLLHSLSAKIIDKLKNNQ